MKGESGVGCRFIRIAHGDVYAIKNISPRPPKQSDGPESPDCSKFQVLSCSMERSLPALY